MDVAITKLEISFSVHATEDKEKNLQAVSNLIPLSIIEQAQIIEEKLEGGYKNPIKYIRLVVTKANLIDKIMKSLSSKLSQEDKKKLNSEFESRIDMKKKSFFLRLDKEDLANNRINIASTKNIVKVSLKMRTFTKDVNLKRFLENNGIL
ncbi:MAG: RNA-binding domain-containing protein [Candidatus Thorarchaeota archaeon]